METYAWLLNSWSDLTASDDIMQTAQRSMSGMDAFYARECLDMWSALPKPPAVQTFSADILYFMLYYCCDTSLYCQDKNIPFLHSIERRGRFNQIDVQVLLVESFRSLEGSCRLSLIKTPSLPSFVFLQKDWEVENRQELLR